MRPVQSSSLCPKPLRAAFALETRKGRSTTTAATLEFLFSYPGLSRLLSFHESDSFKWSCPAMLIDLDQNTLANMTAALEFVCKRLPVDKDTPATRKQIADELIARAKSGCRTYGDFQDAGTKILAGIVRPKRFNWFGLWGP
jgi:hypothetical protein